MIMNVFFTSFLLANVVESFLFRFRVQLLTGVVIVFLG